MGGEGSIVQSQVRSVSVANYFQAFPPKYEPRWDRTVEEKPLVKIIYPEDWVRARSSLVTGSSSTCSVRRSQPPSCLWINTWLWPRLGHSRSRNSGTELSASWRVRDWI